MISIRLKPNRTDAIVIPSLIDFYGIQATAFKYYVVRNVSSLANASFTSQDSATSVQYDISADSMGGGEIIFEGIFKGQSTVNTIDLNLAFNHSAQLTRGIIDNDSAGNIFTIAVTPTTNNDDAIVALTWQEHTL
jgi:hypothetical protein